MYKNCFKWISDIDNLYIHKILKCIISLRDDTSEQILQFVFDKCLQYNIQLNYNILFLSCIEFDNEPCLNLICHKSKTRFYFESLDTNILYNFMCFGEFHSILYITNILHESLNSQIYLNVIKQGISKLSSDILFNKIHLSKLMILSSVLTPKNYCDIKNHIKYCFKNEYYIS
jgi:hypothetical protein